MQHPTSNIIVTSGKVVGIEKYIMEHYSYLNFQASKEGETKEEKLRSPNLPCLINALDRKNQSMKIAVIEPTSAGGLSSENVIEFKLDMSQFSVVDIVDFFKHTSEIMFRSN